MRVVGEEDSKDPAAEMGDASFVLLCYNVTEGDGSTVATTVKVRSKHSVTIPEEVRRQVDLKIGDRVEVAADEGRIIIRPVIEIPREQAWYWTKAWQVKERQADEDIAAGRIFGPLESGKALIRSLKRRR